LIVRDAGSLLVKKPLHPRAADTVREQGNVVVQRVHLQVFVDVRVGPIMLVILPVVCVVIVLPMVAIMVFVMTVMVVLISIMVLVSMVTVKVSIFIVVLQMGIQ